jgi:RNA polymerase sigma factor
MLFERFKGKKQGGDETQNLEELVSQVQAGNEQLRDRLIQDYRPFMIKVASRVCQRYVDPRTDDEFSVVLEGFHEALQHFSQSHNTRFLTFAEMVMKRRLIDFIRKEQRYRWQIPLTSFETEGEEEHVTNPVENEAAIEVYNQEQETQARKMEIEKLADYLKAFNITFNELVRLSPKHKDSRYQCFSIAKLIAADHEMVQHLMATKTLPIKRLLERLEVSKKTLERHRKYIIAIFLVYYHSFPYMQEYLRVDGKD